MPHNPLSQLYEIASPDTDAGKLPVGLAEMKECLKLPSTPGPEDDFISLLLEASTQDVEKALGRREIRARIWTLLQDDFEDRILLRRDPVASITSVEHLVSGSFVAVASSVFYLKKSHTFSEILVSDGQSYPTDTDTIEHGIKIIFLTEPHRCTDIAKTAIKRQVTFMRQNRGDCDPSNSREALEASGAEGMLSRLTIKRI